MKVLLIILLIITVLVLGLLAYQNTTKKMPDLIFWDNRKSEDKEDKKDKKDKKKDKKKDETEKLSSFPSYEVVEKYNLPEVLSEVSDITHVKDNLFACIQDELGIIFIYDTYNKKIEKQIRFAGQGDYEGIALVGTTAYVVKSSGEVYEVSGIEIANPLVKEYKTYLTAQNNVEAVCYDKANNRLLLAYKGEEADGSSKGIYSFDLKNKQLAKSPVYSIDLNNSSFARGSKKNKQSFKPSAIAIHPTNGDYYITEGTNPKLLILDKEGKIKALVPLSGKDFTQPEGITFNSAGELFISNEGKNGNGNILKVKL
ncbi:MAG: hypothetical protein JWR18_3023 [Segetibacter sp.]|nr:hypothetical protein [Segetibacter sp.]